MEELLCRKRSLTRVYSGRPCQEQLGARNQGSSDGFLDQPSSIMASGTTTARSGEDMEELLCRKHSLTRVYSGRPCKEQLGARNQGSSNVVPPAPMHPKHATPVPPPHELAELVRQLKARRSQATVQPARRAVLVEVQPSARTNSPRNASPNRQFPVNRTNNKVAKTKRTTSPLMKKSAALFRMVKSLRH